MTTCRLDLVTTMSQGPDDAGGRDRTDSDEAAHWRGICPHCGGTGLIERSPCPNCGGTGRTSESDEPAPESGD